MSLELSVEFYPPQQESAVEKLRQAREKLRAINPAFYSVTFGAGGATQEFTFATVKEMVAEGYEVCPHLTCIGATQEKVRAILSRYKALGVKRIVALRGDLPSGVYGLGEFKHAADLVAFIRAETGDHFHISVAAYPECHPQAGSARADLLALKSKFDAGANAAITQYFFNADAYSFFIDAAEKAGIHAPIIPGIMPVMNFNNLRRFSSVCGAEIPRWMERRFDDCLRYEENYSALAIEVITRLCDRVIASGAPGLHFYTMNTASAVLKICEHLKLPLST